MDNPKQLGSLLVVEWLDILNHPLVKRFQSSRERGEAPLEVLDTVAPF